MSSTIVINGTDPMEGKADSSGAKSKKGVIQREEDGQSAMEGGLQTYRDLCAPIQLSLEILTNLLTCWIRHENDMEVDMDIGEEILNSRPLLEKSF